MYQTPAGKTQCNSNLFLFRFRRILFLDRARLQVESVLWSHFCVIIVIVIVVGVEDPPGWLTPPSWLPPHVMDGWGARLLRWLRYLFVLECFDVLRWELIALLFAVCPATRIHTSVVACRAGTTLIPACHSQNRSSRLQSPGDLSVLSFLVKS